MGAPCEHWPEQSSEHLSASGLDQQLFDQLLQLIEIGFTDVSFDDLPLLVDQIGRGRQLHIAPSLGHGPGVVDRHLKWQLPCLRKVHNRPAGRNSWRRPSY